MLGFLYVNVALIEKNTAPSSTSTNQIAKLQFRREDFQNNVQRRNGGQIVASASTMNIAAIAKSNRRSPATDEDTSPNENGIYF